MNDRINKQLKNKIGELMYLIETKDLTKRYSHVNVVDHVNMHIEENSIYGFVGENGSGKTTIMRLLTGLAEPTSGGFTMFGVDNKSPHIYKYRKQLSAIVETTSLEPTMTAIENMRYLELYLGIKLTNEERKNLLTKVNLGSVGNKKVKNFSLGMKQILGIALALINKPKLMLLDEPMNGLDPEGIAELRDLLIDLCQRENMTILISSHILSELEKIASHYGFIHKGHLIEEITAEELQNKCRKSLNVKVDNVGNATNALREINITDLKTSPNGEIKIYDDVRIVDVIKVLDKNKVEILAINSNDESVEDYYLNLIKEVR